MYSAARRDVYGQPIAERAPAGFVFRCRRCRADHDYLAAPPRCAGCQVPDLLELVPADAGEDGGGGGGGGGGASVRTGAHDGCPCMGGGGRR